MNCKNCGAPKSGFGQCPYCGTAYEGEHELMLVYHGQAIKPEDIRPGRLLLFDTPRIPLKTIRS